MKTTRAKIKRIGWATGLPMLYLTFTTGFVLTIPASRIVRAESRAAGHAFTSVGKARYVFDTGVLRGEIRKDDLTLGLSSMVYVPSGTQLNGKYAIFSYYRVFTTNKRYADAAWDWPSTSKLLPDGAVRIAWPAKPEHPFEMTATYRLSGDATIDLETVVKAQKDLPHFEVFLASYFHAAFPTSRVYVQKNPKTQGKPNFLAAEKSFGHWQMFPRSDDVLPIIHDGRWDKKPNPVDWAIMPRMAAPIGVRQTATGDLAMVLMAPPKDCFAISTPYEGEGHYSLYMSLFGQDVQAGQTVKARCRLAVVAGASTDRILALYKKYMKELQGSNAADAGW
jgi:hypothetical protein